MTPRVEPGATRTQAGLRLLCHALLMRAPTDILIWREPEGGPVTEVYLALGHRVVQVHGADDSTVRAVTWHELDAPGHVDVLVDITVPAAAGRLDAWAKRLAELLVSTLPHLS